MKKQLIILALSVVVAMASKAQFTAALETGYSPTNKVGMVGFNVGYNWKLVNVSAGIQANTSSDVTKGVALNVRIGHEIVINERWFATPVIGYSHHTNSSDIKSLNGNYALYSMELARNINFQDEDHVRIYISYTKTGPWQFASIGVRGIF